MLQDKVLFSKTHQFNLCNTSDGLPAFIFSGDWKNNLSLAFYDDDMGLAEVKKCLLETPGCEYVETF